MQPQIKRKPGLPQFAPLEQESAQGASECRVVLFWPSAVAGVAAGIANVVTTAVHVIVLVVASAMAAVIHVLNNVAVEATADVAAGVVTSIIRPCYVYTSAV
jgi:hypothetical protein